MRLKFFLYFFLIFSLNIFSQNELVTVSGFVTDKEFRLGNATVSFINSSNKTEYVKSDMSGNFSIKLPKNKYRVTVQKKGYTSLVDKDFFVDYIFNQPKNLILNMTNNTIDIYGKVIDNFGDPLKKANINIKIGEKLLEIETNDDGVFNFKGQVGLISIFAEKVGFYGNGISLLIQNQKFINDISIVLEAKTFYISGALIKENTYLKNTYLELINASNNKVIASLNTSNDGLFEFRNILNYEKAYFRIPSLGFRSNIFSINEDLRQFNIFTD